MSRFAWVFLQTLFLEPLFAAPRLITTSPQLTEWYFQLGQGSSIVAVSDQTRFPLEARRLPTVGPLFQPSIERSVFYAPDEILLDRSSYDRRYAETMRRLGIKTTQIELNRVAALLANSGTSPTISDGKTVWERLQAAQPLAGKTFIAFTWAEPAILFGQETFLSDLLSGLGARNLADELPPANWYPKVSEEWLMGRKPDFIFYLRESEWAESQIQTGTRRWWPKLPPRIVGLDPDQFSRVSLTPILNAPALVRELTESTP